MTSSPVDVRHLLSQRIDAPAPALISEVVRARAARSPDAIAVECGAVRWPYADLLAETERTAASLHAQGAEPGEVVAVTHGRGPALVASVLAILAGGMRLLTVDPVLPARRRRLMISEAGVRHVLGPEVGRPSGRLSWSELAPPSPDDPAYVFFTSGTTGVPNAVLGMHKGLAHFILWQRDEFHVGPGDRCGQLTGLSFDVLLRDLLLPLSSGATLVIPDRDLAPEEVLPWLADERISILHAVPSLASAWAGGRERVGDGGLRCTFFAGEPLSGELVERWRRVTGAREVVNLYGPTETTLAKCAHRVPSPAPPGLLPVGRPLPDTQVVLLDPDHRPCMIGEEGEVAIRTPFRTLGYLHPRGDSGSRFIANPYRADPGDLLYLTGDRGRQRADGSFEILGRLDDQVKIRGIRIEPDEVAAVLAGHPGIASAAVVSRLGEDGTPELLAYVIDEDRSSPSGDGDLRAYLLDRLPAVALPVCFTRLDRLPLTANGKLDRRALVTSKESREESPPKTVAPADDWLARIWSEVLGTEVAPDGDFFALGGHSLLAARMLAKVRDEIGVEIPIRSLFDAPTLEAFSRVLDDAQRHGTRAALPGSSRGRGE